LTLQAELEEFVLKHRAHGTLTGQAADSRLAKPHQYRPVFNDGRKRIRLHWGYT